MSRTHNSLTHGQGQWWLINASEGLTCRKDPKRVTYKTAELYMPHISPNVLKEWFRWLKIYAQLHKIVYKKTYHFINF